MSAMEEYRKLVTETYPPFHAFETQLVKEYADDAIAELEAERNKWEWVARDIAGAFPQAAAIVADAISRWQPCEGGDR